MLTNADITLFEKDSHARHFIENVYFSDCRGQTVTKNGVQTSDSVLVYIYSGGYIPESGDILVKNRCDFLFDNSCQKSLSESMKTFRGEYPDFAVVKTVNNYSYGSLPHIEITAR